MSEVRETLVSSSSEQRGEPVNDSLSPIAALEGEQNERWRCLVSGCLKFYSTRAGLRTHLTRRHSTIVTPKDERTALLETSQVFINDRLPCDDVADAATKSRSLRNIPPPPLSDSIILSEEQLAPWKRTFRKQWNRNSTFKKISRDEGFYKLGPVPYYVVVSILGHPHSNEASSSARFGRWAWRWSNLHEAKDFLDLIGGPDALRRDIFSGDKLAERVEAKRFAVFYSECSEMLVFMIRSEFRNPSGRLSAPPVEFASPFFKTDKELFDEVSFFLNQTPEERVARIIEQRRIADEKYQMIVKEIHEKVRRNLAAKGIEYKY